MQDPKTAKGIISVKNYAMARAGLLIVLIFTLVNTLFSFFDSEMYFLFSLSLPLYFIYPEGIMAGEMIDIIFLVISIVFIAAIALCWLMSKKHFGWMIGALVLFLIDCYFLGVMIYFAEAMYGAGLEFTFDAIIHILVIVETIVGIVAGAKLKKLTPKGTAATAADILLFFEEDLSGKAQPSEAAATTEIERNELPDSPILGAYDGKNIGAYLIVVYDGKQIQIVRKMSATLLIIDGQIYAQKKGMINKSYDLSCNVSGVAYQFTHTVNFASAMFTLTANGKTIAIKA